METKPMCGAITLLRRLTLKKKAILALSLTSILALLLGGGIAYYLISKHSYREMEHRIEQSIDGIHIAIQILLLQGVNDEPGSVSDTYLEQIHLLGEKLKQRMGSQIFITSPEGEVIFHPGYQGKKVKNLLDVQSYKRVSQELLSDIQQGKHQGRFDFQHHDPISGKLTLSLVSYLYLPDLNWIIGVQVPQKDIGLPTLELISAILLSFVVTASVVAWLLKHMSQPFFSDLEELNRAVKRVGEGSFDIEILSARDDELGELSEQFVCMARNLAEVNRQQSERQQELEQLVAERTQELKEKNDKLEHLAVTDCLTCVGNRRHFDQVLKEELMRANRTHSYLCLMLLDVDYFKAYNDTYGHPAGDDCLRKIAYVMKQCAQRTIDLVARYGGEEFTLVALDTSQSGAEKIASQIQLKLDGLALEHKGSPLGRVTVSIGICVMEPHSGYSAESLIETADAALYKAKQGGRNRIEAITV